LPPSAVAWQAAAREGPGPPSLTPATEADQQAEETVMKLLLALTILAAIGGGVAICRALIAPPSAAYFASNC
jgi:hypothetical protein